MLRNRTIPFDATLLDALNKMDAIDRKLLLVLKNNKFVSLLSAGDIQRAIIQNVPLNTEVHEVLRKGIRIATPNDNYEDIKRMMFDFRMELCPVVTEENDIVDIYFWEDVFAERKQIPQQQFHLPVVIMAGGYGSRLKPLTSVFPKPLIPLGDKTIIEQIFDRFHQHGCTDYFISVNYKAELIKYYLTSQKLSYNIEYFQEEKPMGTAGSLSLLDGKINETFFVSNCDILVEQDYSEILEYHRSNKNELTIVAALKHYHIPYGTIDTTNNGKMVNLIEKPDLNYKINTGMYVLEPQLLKEIPKGQFFHITDLIDKIHKRGGNVGVFPVSEKSWKDIGSIFEYLKLLKL